MELSNVASLQITMFSTVFFGYTLAKRKLIPEQTRSVLTELILNLTLPLNIVLSFQMEFSVELLKKFTIIILIGFCTQFLCFCITLFAFKNHSEDKRKIFNYATIVSNSGFLGNPIAEGTFGLVGLMYASIFTIPTRIAMWSAGLSIFTMETDIKKAVKKVVFHPCMVAVYIGMSLMIFGVKLGGVTKDTLSSIAKCTTPLTMILIGSMVAEINDFKSIITRDIIYFSIIRLIVIPSIVYITCNYLKIDPLITGVAVLLSGMPAGSSTPILAAKYNGDYILGTKLVVFSTLLTLISVPIWSSILIK